MKQIFEHYEKWEDYQAGMYQLTDIIDKDLKVINSIKLLSDNNLFYDICKKILIDWPIASNVNLTNKNQNRRAWLGAAACMYKNRCPEYLTRIAWNLLNKEIQDKANLIAEKIISEYEKRNTYGKTLFE
jgi:hypothetical protein